LCAAGAPARANQPGPPDYLPEPSRWGLEWGYTPGSFYVGGQYAVPEAAPLVGMLAGLTQLDLTSGDTDHTVLRFRRARLTLGASLYERAFAFVSGDAGMHSVPDAYLAVVRGSSSVAVVLRAGRLVVPFSLEQTWSDAKLPFAEHVAAV